MLICKSSPLSSFRDRLLVSGTGPLADSGLGATGMVRTNASADNNDPRPDVQIVTWNINYNVDYGVRSAEFAGLTREAYHRIYQPHQDKSVKKACLAY